MVKVEVLVSFMGFLIVGVKRVFWQLLLRLLKFLTHLLQAVLHYDINYAFGCLDDAKRADGVTCGLASLREPEHCIRNGEELTLSFSHNRNRLRRSASVSAPPVSLGREPGKRAYSSGERL